jgi:adenylate cyclase
MPGLADRRFRDVMSPEPGTDRHDEAFWRDFLTRGDGMERRVRGVFRRIPHGPRCKLCAAPFRGVGAPFMRMIGKRPSPQNPKVCGSCFDFMIRHHGGAEIEATVLFADIRGSTAMAESMPTPAFRGLLDRFYTTASEVVFDHDGTVDKFIGDELMAMFFPLISGPHHVAQAVAAAHALLVATGHGDPDGPWVPIGAGVHTGMVWVGAVGDATHTELTGVGDAVNTTARLAAAAGPGEVLVTDAAAVMAGLDPVLERRSLELKGKAAATDVVVLTVGSPVAAG